MTTTSPELFDVPAAIAREIARLQTEVRAAPDFIEPINYLSNALEASNRCNEALELIDKTIARASGATAEERPFRDTGSRLTWLLDHRARVLECLGRRDEALQRRIRAAQLTENGGSNTSQALNLAHALADRERPTEALEVLEAVGPMSGYGKTVEQSARLKVYLQLGDDQGVQTALAYLSDVRAAIDRVGRIESYPYLRWSGWQ